MAENTKKIQQILDEYTRAQTNHVFLLHFYKLEKSGVCLYLFGTNHSVTLKQFPKKALAGIEGILEQCSYFICEGFRPSMNQEILEKFGYLRALNDTGPYWLDELSGSEKEAVNSILDSFKERHQLTFENKNIQIGAIPLFIIDNIFGSGMDSEIQKKYRRENNFYSLDEDDDLGYEITHLSQNEETVHSIEELKPIIESHFFNEEHKALLINSQKNYFSGEPVLADEDQQEEIQEVNTWWCREIMTMRRQREIKSNMVAVVGVAHLYGEVGLLSLFEKKGFSLTRMDSDGQFNPVPAQHLLPLYLLTQNKDAGVQSASDSDTLSETMQKKMTFTE